MRLASPDFLLLFAWEAFLLSVSPPAGALDWTPAPAPAPPAAWTLVVPALPPADAVLQLARDPASFPRPSAHRGDQTVPLPFSVDTALLRREPGPEGSAVLAWTATADLADGGGGVLVAQLHPGTTPEPFFWTPWDGEPPAPSERRLDTVRRSGWRTPVAATQAARDPLRHGGPSPQAMRKMLEVPLDPVVRAWPITDTTSPVLAATPDDGAHWLALRLDAPVDSVEAVHVLRADDVLGVLGAEPPRLVVVPRPIGPRSTLQMLEVAVDGTTTSLGWLGRPQAPWSQRVTSVRLGVDGSLEAVVLVHDLAWPPEDRTDSWGTVVRRTADGAWFELGRFPLPEADPSVMVRFADTRSGRLLLDSPGKPPLSLVLPAAAR